MENFNPTKKTCCMPERPYCPLCDYGFECYKYPEEAMAFPDEDNATEWHCSYPGFLKSNSRFVISSVNWRFLIFDIVFLFVVLIFFLLGFLGILQQYLSKDFLAYCLIAAIVFLVGDLIIMGVRIWKNRQLRKKK